MMTMFSFARLCACASLCAMSFAAHAAAPDTSFSIGDIVVTARSMAGQPSAATSLDQLGGDVAQRANISYAWDLIGQMPGVLVTNFNQGTTSGKISLRGFNGEGEVNAVKLLIDGIPANSNDGNMPYLDMVFPLEIAGVDLVRGTSDPRFGLHNIAGNVDIRTRAGGTYQDMRLSMGSYATYEAQLAAGREAGRLSQNYMLAYRQTESYRAHGAADRLSLSGKWAYALTDDVRLGLTLRHYRAHADEPGYLTQSDAARDPRMTNSYNASDGDDRQMQMASLSLDAQFGPDAGLVARLYANRLRDDRFVKFSATAAQQRRVTQEDHQGALFAVHAHQSLAGLSIMWEAGGDVQNQDNISLRYLTADRRTLSQTRDQNFTLTIGGVYAQAMLAPAPWLQLTPAYRVDWVGGQFRNRLTNISAPINDYGRIDQPKMSITLTPVRPVTFYGSWGRSFQIGVGSGAYLIPPRQNNLAPSINGGWESGVKIALPHQGQLRLALWQQSATGEIKRKLNDPLGDFDNLGATRRRGADVQVRVAPVSGVQLWGALSWQKAIITQPDPATPNLLGAEIDHVPHWLISGGADWAVNPTLRLSLTATGQSSYTLSTASLQGRWGDFLRVTTDLGWRFRPKAELLLSVRNIGNSRAAYIWWDGSQRLFSPAEGRSVTLSLRTQL